MNDVSLIAKKAISKVCIVGGGNIGHYLIATIGRNENIEVNLLTSTPGLFRHYVESTNTVNGEVTVGRLNKASSDPREVIPDADMIIFTVPSHTYGKYLDMIYPYTANGTILGFTPGTGGVEFLAKDFITEKTCMIFGTQRVPSGTKVTSRGYKVDSLGHRKDLRIATIPKSITKDVCDFFRKTLGITTVGLPNYLSVTLTPSNPILHTSRLYGLFHGLTKDTSYEQPLSFYKKWDDFSSRILLGCNEELQNCCRQLSNFDLTGVISLKEHYEITEVDGKDDIERLTLKMRSLPFLKDLVPMFQDERGEYKPDLECRYFKEDFPFGLCIIKSFCDVCNLDTPYIDRVLGWFDALFNAQYFVGNRFEGVGLRNLPVLANFGLTTVEDVYKYYLELELAASTLLTLHCQA